MKTNTITLPEITSREKWLDARKKLLKKEKQLTQARDAVAAERRRLPMVKVEKDYQFNGPEGEVELLDLFNGRRQLIIYHFMFDPDWDKGCPSCSAWADHIARGHLNHINSRSTTLALVSRAPFHKLKIFKQRMEWKIPWYSSYGSDFNYDYHVTTDESVTPVTYNYRDKATLEHLGQHYHVEGEQPGISCFLRDGEQVYHTYSTYGRGMEAVGGANYFLDLTAFGRQEEWEEPKGRATGLGTPAGSGKIRYPNEYDE
ncbi:DUF899 domain-containing protein [Fodinibius salsisoli]|uniref:DUF899 domain-containing protein n=1 Tax=Fodinibius salsisoli TaxID=2820877 RepID=A0ABT3PHX5_9BACT|nr:DUF899 domain-containing protein [Fodinibius salsisoli]MCW9705530.1 DUF899 domain-containing protein [Fodinibius salsisoli]